MRSVERRALQGAVTLGCLVPLAAGAAGMLAGPAMVGATGPVAADSHYRYLSGLLFAIGLGFASAIPGIECKGARFRLLTMIVVVGGLGRLLSLMMVGPADSAMTAALAMELIVTPALAVWQRGIARMYSGAASRSA